MSRRRPADVYTLRIPRFNYVETGKVSVVAKKNKKKKDAQLVVRLNTSLRDRFMDACDDLDTTAAHEVRRFIKRFIKRYEKGEADD